MLGQSDDTSMVGEEVEVALFGRNSPCASCCGGAKSRGMVSQG
jgi:hypothetical protein